MFPFRPTPASGFKVAREAAGRNTLTTTSRWTRDSRQAVKCARRTRDTEKLRPCLCVFFFPPFLKNKTVNATSITTLLVHAQDCKRTPQRWMPSDGRRHRCAGGCNGPTEKSFLLVASVWETYLCSVFACVRALLHPPAWQLLARGCACVACVRVCAWPRRNSRSGWDARRQQGEGLTSKLWRCNCERFFLDFPKKVGNSKTNFQSQILDDGI